MAAGTTYDLISSQTIANGTTATISFTSIPSTYTDIILMFNGGGESGGGNVQIKVNNDTGANYSFTILRGNGSAASSDRESNFSGYFRWGAYATPGSGSYSTFDVAHFLDYSNTTTYKTVLTRTNNPQSGSDATIGLWQSTSAINRLDITLPAPSYFMNGSTFRLYGIASA